MPRKTFPDLLDGLRQPHVDKTAMAEDVSDRRAQWAKLEFVARAQLRRLCSVFRGCSIVSDTEDHGRELRHVVRSQSSSPR
jgi:hypothetical protein